MDWLLYLITTMVAIIGTIGHTVTLFVLRNIRQKINNALDSTTRQLMTGLAVCELLFCATAVPLYIWNALVGNAWPFNVAGICYYSQFWLFNLSSISLFHTMVIAVLRFMAVFKPMSYSKVVKSGFIRKTILVIPWLLGCFATVFGYAANLYRCGFEQYSGVCSTLPVESNKTLSPAAAEARLNEFEAINGLCNVLAPVGIGCVLYICVLVRLRRRQRQQQEQIKFQLKRLRTVRPATAAPLSTVAATLYEARLKTGIPSANRTEQPAETAGGGVGAARSFNAVLVVALVCFVNLFLVCPTTLVYTFGMYNAISNAWPYSMNILYIFYYVAFCTTPFVYFASSTEMRGAYVGIFKRCFCCGKWCNKISSKETDVGVANNTVVRAEREASRRAA